MLIEFTVGNFRSIADRVTLSMIAAPIKSGPHAEYLDKENLIRIDDKLSLLKTAAIYGSNASGKSNILAALHTMGAFMRFSVVGAARGIIPFSPFLLISGYKEEPSHFEVVFLMDGLQYRYGFEISASRVEREWLYFVPTLREATLFERKGDHFSSMPRIKGGAGLTPRVAPQTLFLTVCRDFNVQIAQKIFQWLTCFPAMSGLDDRAPVFTLQCLEEKKSDAEIVDFMRLLDVGISGIEVSVLPGKNEEEDIEDGRNSRKSYNVETVHAFYNREGEQIANVNLNMRKHESEGTQKLFAMSGKIVEVLKNGHILAIDEIDARLHPSLTRKIVEMFHSEATNPNNAQLIFATHDTNLLDKRLFRRDQIWFAEKNRMGATHLYSLAELKVRNDAWYEKEYIEGRYGAIPFPGDFERLFDQTELAGAKAE